MHALLVRFCNSSVMLVRHCKCIILSVWFCNGSALPVELGNFSVVLEWISNNDSKRTNLKPPHLIDFTFS
jgi:hypothetical protein